MSDLTSTKRGNIGRVESTFQELIAMSLHPHGKYDIMLNGKDHNFATKRIGKDFGQTLTADDNGMMKLGILFDFVDEVRKKKTPKHDKHDRERRHRDRDDDDDGDRRSKREQVVDEIALVPRGGGCSALFTLPRTRLVKRNRHHHRHDD